jgi:hypothetical protein
MTTDGAGNLSWNAAPGGGILSVAHDSTLTGDGNLTPLSVVHLATARQITLQATGGTKITVTPASLDDSAAATMTEFEIVGLDAGTY